MGFIDSVYQKLRQQPKRIVFPDGEMTSVIRAAEIFYQRQLGVPILLGRRSVIEQIAHEENISLHRVGIIDPAKSSELPVFCERLEKLERYRKAGMTDSLSIMVKPNYFAAMMVQYSLADAIVGGVSTSVGSLLRPMLHVVKPLPFADVISSCTIMEMPNSEHGDNGVLFFADTGVVPEPSMTQLATIAVQCGHLARQVFGHRARVAMLSYSTKGSTRTPATEKVAGAAELARHIAEKVGVDMSIDGEMQADAALDSTVAALKMTGSTVGGKANVLIFPDLNSGNIAMKLVQVLSGAEAYGQIITGFTRPAADMPRGSSPDKIASMAALVGLQSVEYRTLYPDHSSNSG